jgi:hypothetical protein
MSTEELRELAKTMRQAPLVTRLLWEIRRLRRIAAQAETLRRLRKGQAKGYCRLAFVKARRARRSAATMATPIANRGAVPNSRTLAVIVHFPLVPAGVEAMQKSILCGSLQSKLAVSPEVVDDRKS